MGINFNMVPIKPENPSPAVQAADQTNVATGPNGEELKPGTTNIVYNNNQQNSASNTMATLGHGTITVGGTTLEQNGQLTDAGEAADSALAGLNRDTNDTTNELWESDYSQDLDVTIDNRIINPGRWDESNRPTNRT